MAKRGLRAILIGEIALIVSEWETRDLERAATLLRLYGLRALRSHDLGHTFDQNDRTAANVIRDQGSHPSKGQQVVKLRLIEPGGD